MTNESHQHSEVFEACVLFAEQEMQLNIHAVRIARGVPRLSPLKECMQSTVMYWIDCAGSNPQHIMLECQDNNCPAVNFRKILPDSWNQVRAVQFIMFSGSPPVTPTEGTANPTPQVP